MLERLRGKRLVFVGDSLNRNMWESLVCVLRNSVKDKRKVFEASGRREFRTEGSYSFVFKVGFFFFHALVFGFFFISFCFCICNGFVLGGLGLQLFG